MRFSISHTHAAQVMFSSISAASFTPVVGCAYEGLLYFCEIEQLQLGRDRYVVLIEAAARPPRFGSGNSQRAPRP